jgi:starvation-inducible DNA-binding protein
LFLPKEIAMPRKAALKSAVAGIGLPEQARKRMIDVLNRLLADTVVLYVKARNFHWNVVGPSFQEMHKFFEARYEELDAMMDAVAERVRALDGTAAGSLADYQKLTRLSEASAHLPPQEMLRALLADYERMARQLREDVEVADDVDDVGTEDFLTGLLEDFEKSAWMIRAYLR